jgi:hypothetical protein
MSKKKKDIEIDIESQNQVRELEQFYVQGKVDNMLQTIEEKKSELVQDMIDYSKKHKEAVKWNKDGCPVSYAVRINPIVITNYFFKPIIPISSQEPIYTAEELGMVFDYYCELLYEVNDKIGNFPSSLTLFCKFAGLTTYTLRRLKNSEDLNMRVIVEKIYDQISDENLTMSQMGIARERTTLFKMKSQNEMVEKAQPNVNINANIVDVDLDRIQERLSKYSQYSNKKGK